MNRRTFVEVSIGVLGTLWVSRARPARRSPDALRLEQGLTAMARADSWFEAHWGAGVIAGAYLCADNGLGEDVTAAIQGDLDIVVDLNRGSFRPFSAQPSRADAVESLTRALEPAISGGLREHGHAVIYTALALRALGDAPHMAYPAVVDGIERQITSIASVRPQKPNRKARTYDGSQELVEATFHSLLRFERLLGHPAIKRPNFTHMVTHTEALVRLDGMGHGELARRGHIGHGVHIDNPVPDVKAEDGQDRSAVTLERILSTEFWKDPEHRAQWHVRWSRRSNPNGDWIASGHLFKVLYAFCELAGRIQDKAVVERCARVLLERYFDPDVQGG